MRRMLLDRLLEIRERRGRQIKEQKLEDSADSSEGAHGSGFEKLVEQGKNRSLFQLALEVEGLLEEQRPKRERKSAGTRTRYIE